MQIRVTWRRKTKMRKAEVKQFIPAKVQKPAANFSSAGASAKRKFHGDKKLRGTEQTAIKTGWWKKFRRVFLLRVFPTSQPLLFLREDALFIYANSKGIKKIQWFLRDTWSMAKITNVFCSPEFLSPGGEDKQFHAPWTKKSANLRTHAGFL